MLLLPKKSQPEGAQQSGVYADVDPALPTKPTTGQADPPGSEQE